MDVFANADVSPRCVRNLADRLRLSDRLGAKAERRGNGIARLLLELVKSMVRASSRGGVPVLSRPTSKPSRRKASPSRPTAPRRTSRGILILPAVDQAVEECAGGEMTAPASTVRPSSRRTPRSASGRLAIAGNNVLEHEIDDFRLLDAQIRFGLSTCRILTR